MAEEEEEEEQAEQPQAAPSASPKASVLRYLPFVIVLLVLQSVGDTFLFGGILVVRSNLRSRPTSQAGCGPIRTEMNLNRVLTSGASLLTLEQRKLGCLLSLK